MLQFIIALRKNVSEKSETFFLWFARHLVDVLAIFQLVDHGLHA